MFENIKPGDEIEVRWKYQLLNGILISKNHDFMIIKLKNGYNLAIDYSHIQSLNVISENKPLKQTREEIRGSGNKVTIIGTGGTIASYVDYSTGAVKPLENAQDVLYAEPDLLKLGDIDAEVLFNIFSEDMNQKYWKILAKKVYEKISEGNGVVVAHGTDTMSFSASALSFLIENPSAPIIFTGSQRSSDRPSSDAYFNLLGAVKVAQSDLGEVAVVMHSSMNDDYLSIHRAVKVRKMHTSRRDAFKSINAEIIGTVSKDLDVNMQGYKKVKKDEMHLYENLSEKVGLIYYYPGMEKELLLKFLDRNDGLIIAGTGLGHISNDYVEDIKNIIDEGKIIAMTSQCLYGSVNLNVYSTGRRLIEAGVIPLGDMLPEVAYIKLSFLLGNFGQDDAKVLLAKNLRGELNERRKE
ncbi:MAG: Glu-tRNA(Gln) amidotransferase subunit GatD [Thermoplasmata archaeon]